MQLCNKQEAGKKKTSETNNMETLLRTTSVR